MPKFKKHDAVTVNYYGGADERRGIIIESGRNVSKVEVTYYQEDGKKDTYIGWFQNKFLTKNK